MGRPPHQSAAEGGACVSDHKYLWICLVYSLYIPYIFHIYFLAMFHIFSLVCFLLYGVKSRSGHVYLRLRKVPYHTNLFKSISGTWEKRHKSRIILKPLHSPGSGASQQHCNAMPACTIQIDTMTNGTVKQ